MMQRGASYIQYLVFGACILFLTVAGVVVIVVVHGADANSTPLLASLIGFAGTIIALFTAIHAAASAAANAAGAQSQVADVQRKVDGHLSALTTAVADAAAAHPDIAEHVADTLSAAQADIGGVG